MGCGFNAGGYRWHHEDALDWLRLQDADVALLQEVQLEKVVSFHGMASHRVPTSPGSPTGNAVLVRAERLDPVNVEIGGALVAAVKARLVGEDFVLVSAHVLTGKRQQEALASFVRCVSRAVVDSRFVVGGDFNVTPTDLDCYDPSLFVGATHVSEPEREALRALEATGLTDLTRALHPEEPSFSWWDYRNGSFHRGWGLRIDLLFVDQALLAKATASFVDRDERKGQKPSDHAPVVGEFDL